MANREPTVTAEAITEIETMIAEHEAKVRFREEEAKTEVRPAFHGKDPFTKQRIDLDEDPRYGERHRAIARLLRVRLDALRHALAALRGEGQRSEWGACPFCGSAEVEIHPNAIASAGHEMGVPGVSVFYAHCDGCGAEGPQEDNEPDAIAAWSRLSVPRERERTDTGRLAEAVDALARSHATIESDAEGHRPPSWYFISPVCGEQFVGHVSEPPHELVLRWHQAESAAPPEVDNGMR